MVGVLKRLRSRLVKGNGEGVVVGFRVNGPAVDRNRGGEGLTGAWSGVRLVRRQEKFLLYT